MGRTCSSETPVTNHQPTPRNIPEDRRPQLRHGGSLKFRIRELYCLPLIGKFVFAFWSHTFVGAFAELRKATISPVLSVCPSVHPSSWGGWKTRLPLKEFSSNFIFEYLRLFLPSGDNRERKFCTQEGHMFLWLALWVHVDRYCSTEHVLRHA